MNTLNIAEKFLAFDDIYDKSGSNFEKILEDTLDMFGKIKDVDIFSNYINDDFFRNYLNNIYYCSYTDNKEYPQFENRDIDYLIKNYKDLNFFVIYLNNINHAFSISFSKNTDLTYDLMFFNSGSGVSMHPYNSEKNLFGCCLLKKNITQVECQIILNNTEEFFKRTIVNMEEVYDFYLGKIFLPDKLYNAHKSKDSSLKKAEYLSDYITEENIIYLKTQATGNCTGRSIFYPIILYYNKILGLSLDISLKKFYQLKVLLSYYIYNRIIDDIISLGPNNLFNEDFKMDYLNESLDIIHIIRLLNNFYEKRKMEYFDEENLFLNTTIEKIKKIDINSLINFNYLNRDVDKKNEEINIKELLIKPEYNHHKILKYIDYISKLKIITNEKYAEFLNCLNNVLELINKQHPIRDNAFSIIYYSILLKKSLLKCYKNVEQTYIYEESRSYNPYGYYGGKNELGKIKKKDEEDEDEDEEDDDEDEDEDEEDEDEEDEGEIDEKDFEEIISDIKSIPESVNFYSEDSVIFICDKISNIISNFASIKKINFNKKNDNEKEDEDNEKYSNNIFDLSIFYNNSLTLFLYINFEFYYTLFNNKKYAIKFKKINFDSFDKNIIPRNEYSYDNIKESDISEFLSENSLESHFYTINSSLNSKNIKNTSNKNLLVIKNLLTVTYININKIIYKQPTISNYFEFFDYIMKVHENSITYLNLNKFNSIIIDVDTYFAEKEYSSKEIKKNLQKYYIDKKYNNTIIGFNDFFNVLSKDEFNLFLETLNKILIELSVNKSINKDNVKTILANIIIFYEIYSIEYDKDIINSIIKNYAIDSLLIETLIKNIEEIDIEKVSKLIFDRKLNLSQKQTNYIRYSKSDEKSKKPASVFYANLNKVDYQYKSADFHSLNNSILINSSIIISKNLDYFNKLIEKIDSIKIDNTLYKNNGKIYYQYENNYLLNFTHNKENIILIIKTNLVPEEGKEDIILNYLLILGDIYSKYKNYNVFNKRVFVLSDDLKSFKSEDKLYTINITDCTVFNESKLLLCNYEIENKILNKFVNNFLIFENKMYINIFCEKDNYLIDLTRYNLTISYSVSDNKFSINNNEIITDFTDKYYLYKWIYGTRNLLIVKNKNKYQILLFNKIFDDKNYELYNEKINMFWFEEKNFGFNDEAEFNYYFIDINPNLLFLDINTFTDKSLYYLCLTYIFFNKINENLNLLNIVNSKFKNNLYDSFYNLDIKLNYYKINTPFIYLIKSYFLQNQEKLHNQRVYFQDIINTNDIFKSNTTELKIYPVNKWRFIKSIGLEEYNRLTFEKTFFINNYYYYDLKFTDYDEIHIYSNKEYDYDKNDIKLVFEDTKDNVYFYFDPLSAEFDEDDSDQEDRYYSSRGEEKESSTKKIDYLNLYITKPSKDFYSDYLSKPFEKSILIKDYENNSITYTNILISKNFESEFLTEYSDLISKIKDESLDNISRINKTTFENIIYNIYKSQFKIINDYSIQFGDIGKKILHIIHHNPNLLYYSILLKSLNDIIDLYDEYEITEIQSKNIILKEILRKINNLTSYHNSINENIYVHLFEFIFGYFIKSDQNQLVNDIYNQFTKDENNRKFYQLLMGSGKTSVVNPLLNLQLVNTCDNFIINVLPESLLNQSYNILNNTLKYLLNIDVLKYDIDRQTNLNNMIFENKKVYLMSDSSYKSLYLNCIENKKDNYKIIKDNAYVIVDEVDFVCDTLKSETNFPIKGSKKPLNLNAEFVFIYRIVDILEENYPSGNLINTFLLNEPNILLLDENKYYDVLDFYKEKLLILINSYLDKEEKDSINNNIEKLLYNQEILLPVDISKKILHKLYFVRTIFNDILPLVLRQKHRLNFGLVNEILNNKLYNFNFIAIPYLALDIPALNKETKISSEFSNYYIKIFLTYISYIAKNSTYIRDIDLHKFLGLIKDIYIDIKNKTKNYIEDKDIKILKTFEQIKLLYSIDYDMQINNIDFNKFKHEKLLENLADKDCKLLYRTIIKKLIKYTLNEYIRIDMQVYNCSFIDTITPSYSRFTSGFTGTPYLYIPFIDQDIKEYQIVENKDDFEKIISGMNNNSEKTDIFNIESNIELFAIVVNNNFSALIDAGSYFINKTSYEVIKEIKKEAILKGKNIETFIFIDKDHIKKYITKKSDKPIIFNESIVPLNGRFIYFDNGHITGQDFKLNPNAIGLITINLENTFRDIAQGIFRLRKLNNGQKISYCLLNKVKEFNDVKNIKELIKWLLKNNEKVLDDRELIGIIQNIRRELKCNCEDYFLGQIENFSPNESKEFYFNSYNFIINDLIKQYLNSTYNNKLDTFVDYLIKLYISKSTKSVLVLRTQEQQQQQEQMQNILQQNVSESAKYKYKYLLVDYFCDLKNIKTRAIDHKLFYDSNFENSLTNSINLNKLYGNTSPYIHLITFKKDSFEESKIFIEYYLSNYIDLVQNLSMYINDENEFYFRLYNMNGILIFDNFKPEILEIENLDELTYYLPKHDSSLQIPNFEKYINGVLMNNTIINNINNNNFSIILNYLEYFFRNNITDVIALFDKESEEINYSGENTKLDINKQYENYQKIIRDYIKTNNSSKNLIFLKDILKLNTIYVRFENLYEKINYIVNDVLIKCSDVETIHLNNDDIYLLLLILGIDEDYIDYDNNCGILICRQTSSYDILEHFGKSNMIKELFKKYNDKICKIINANIIGKKTTNDINYNIDKFIDLLVYNDLDKIKLIQNKFNIIIKDKINTEKLLSILEYTKKINPEFNLFTILKEIKLESLITEIRFNNEEIITFMENFSILFFNNYSFFEDKIPDKFLFKNCEKSLKKIINNIIELMDYEKYITTNKRGIKQLSDENKEIIKFYYNYFYKFLQKIRDLNELSNDVKNFIVKKWTYIFSKYFKGPEEYKLKDIYKRDMNIIIVNKIKANEDIINITGDVISFFTDNKVCYKIELNKGSSGGSSTYYNKYIKYKLKYINLKNK
jgi:hypothetical protein